jgi:glyoxylase-like metal-dependent hydrolase (beta-lactamase superfamily II)
MAELPALKRYDSSMGVRVYRIRCRLLPDLLGWVYLLFGAGPPTLVDTGSGRETSTPDILAGLERIRSEFGERAALRDIRRILITHQHVDHIGGLAELAALTGAEVGAHPLEVAAISRFEDHVVLGRRTLRQFFRQAGVSPSQHDEMLERYGLTAGRIRSTRVDFLLEDDQVLDGLRVIHTPGHAPGHVCLLAGDLLLAADHILPVTIPQQWPESSGPYNGLGHYLESLRRIEQIPGIEIALGGHEMATRHVYHRIAQIRDTQFRRIERLLEMIRTAAQPPCLVDLAAKMYTQVKGMRAVLALMDVGSRIEYLFLRGRVAIANLDEIDRDVTPVYRYRVA